MGQGLISKYLVLLNVSVSLLISTLWKPRAEIYTGKNAPPHTGDKANSLSIQHYAMSTRI